MKQWTNEELWDYLDGYLPSDLRQKIETDLHQDPALQRRLQELQTIDHVVKDMPMKQPSPELRKRFQSFLTEQIEQQGSTHEAKVVGISWMRIAVAASIMFFVGYFVVDHYQTNQQLNTTAHELALAKKRILNNMQDKSTIGRIQAVNSTYELQEEDPEITTTLIQVLKTDESANVRLATLQALGNYTSAQTLKEVIIQQLKEEKDPAIQISMIQLLANLKNTSAIDPLKDLLDDDAVSDDVKGEAQMGIFKLDAYQKM